MHRHTDMFLAIVIATALPGAASLLTLSSNEAILDGYMDQLAQAESADGTWNPRVQHDYQTLKRLKHTELYQIINEMPKGAMLHCHRSACYNYSEVLHQMAERNPTYKETYGVQVYIYNVSNAATQRDRKIHLSADALCPNEALEYEATPLQDADLEVVLGHWSVEHIDMFSLSDSQIWDEFELRFDLPKYAARWEPVARELAMPSLVAEAARHGISYVEPTGSLGKPYFKNCTSDGNVGHKSYMTAVEEVKMWDTYMSTSPSSVQVNLVCSSFRGHSDMMKELNKCLDVWKATKNNPYVRVVGWDIVGREDRFGLAETFLDVWEKARDEGLPVVPHSGETIYPQALPTPFLPKSPAANLLVHIKFNNTVRVGHAIALSVMSRTMIDDWASSGIGVTVTPISNQLLGYVQSSGFHQTCDLAAAGIKVSISHDDAPIFSREHSVSHDFGYIFRSCHTCGTGLALLKELIVNGWETSLLEDTEKQTHMKNWNTAWEAWVAKKVSEICDSQDPPGVCSGTEGTSLDYCPPAPKPMKTCREVKSFYKEQKCCGNPAKELGHALHVR